MNFYFIKLTKNITKFPIGERFSYSSPIGSSSTIFRSSSISSRLICGASPLSSSSTWTLTFLGSSKRINKLTKLDWKIKIHSLHIYVTFINIHILSVLRVLLKIFQKVQVLLVINGSHTGSIVLNIQAVQLPGTLLVTLLTISIQLFNKDLYA